MCVRAGGHTTVCVCPDCYWLNVQASKKRRGEVKRDAPEPDGPRSTVALNRPSSFLLLSCVQTLRSL